MSDFDPKHRELCPDGACIGVIGPDGVCRECGRVSPSAVSDPRHQGLDLEAGEEDEIPEELAGRRLCPDGACIGVIGDDGRCKECGRAAEAIEGDEGGEDEGAEGDEEDEEDDEGDEEDDEGDEEDDGGDEAPDSDGVAAEALPGAPKGWAGRRLCPDGTCVGVLDANGKCPVCGGHAPAANSST